MTMPTSPGWLTVSDAKELDKVAFQRGTRPWSSGDQVLVLGHEKEFKDTPNSELKSTSFIKAKVHT